MITINAPDLSPGMRLAIGIHYYDLNKNKAVELPKLHLLTDEDIISINSSDVNSIYIDKFPENMNIHNILSKELKEQSLQDINSIAANFKNNQVKKSDFVTLQDTATQLIDYFSHDKSTMINIFDLKKYDDYTFHHSLSVCVMSLAIATELKFSKAELNELALSALLHDIGKVSVPKEILNKPSKLTPEEFTIMKQHPLNAGKYLLSNNLINQNIFRAIVCHHEKWNGTGYPSGLKEGQIPLYSRVISVADVYDALTSHRPYREPSEPTEAIEYIMGGCGSHFDPDIVKAFLRKVAPYPIGTKVKLSNDQIANVISNNPEQPLRPIVSIINSDEVYDLYNDFSKLNITVKNKM